MGTVAFVVRQSEQTVGFQLTPLLIHDDHINYGKYAFSFDALTNYATAAKSV